MKPDWKFGDYLELSGFALTNVFELIFLAWRDEAPDDTIFYAALIPWGDEWQDSYRFWRSTENGGGDAISPT